MAKFKLSVGDIFTIPLNDKEVGFGQVITPYDKTCGGFMMAVFDFKTNDVHSVLLKDVGNSELLFLGFTFDAKIYHKDWILIGNYTNNIESIVMPYFRLGTPPSDIYIVNYKGERLKSINEKVFVELTYQTEIAPIRYQNALKAHFDYREWKSEDYDKLLYSHSVNSKGIFESI